MRVVEWRAPHELRIANRVDPIADEGQIVVRVDSCGICGSDLHSYNTGFATVPGQVLGHEFCGTILQARGVAGAVIGERVVVRPLAMCGKCAHCAAGETQLCEHRVSGAIGYGLPGAFAEQVLVTRAVIGQTVFPLPDSIDNRAGSLVEPLAVALRSARLSRCDASDVVLVVGGGSIGLGVTRFLRLMGVGAIVVSEPSELRRTEAVAQGADFVLDPKSDKIVERMRELTGPGSHGLGARVDAVVDCAGAESGLGDALKCLRDGGRLVLAAVYGKRVNVSLDRVIEKSLLVEGSFGYQNEFSDVLDLLANGEVVVDNLVSHVFPLDQINEAFLAQLDREHTIKVQVEPNVPSLSDLIGV